MTTNIERLRIVVLGYLVRGPLGGLAWHHLQYLLGLRELGHDVLFLEDSDDYPSCYDPQRHVVDTNPVYGLRFARSVFSRLDFATNWAYYDAHTRAWSGPSAEQAVQFCGRTDICLNLSGVNPLRPWLESIPVRVLVDTDPVFTQIRHRTNEAACQAARKHTFFCTFAENMGLPSCQVPDDGLPWRPTRQPLFADAWRATPGPASGRFTTVMQWDSYPAVEFEGRRYGMKSDAFRPYSELPSSVHHPLELALGSEGAPRDQLLKSGWNLKDPLEVTRTPWTYQDYIRKSLGEFSIAKHGYVVSNSGWFSERSVGYLASGRPVVTQDTGFSRWLPARSGLLSFTCPEEAKRALDSVLSDYPSHCRAAREIALEYFDFRKVLPTLIEEAMNEAPAS